MFLRVLLIVGVVLMVAAPCSATTVSEIESEIIARVLQYKGLECALISPETVTYDIDTPLLRILVYKHSGLSDQYKELDFTSDNLIEQVTKIKSLESQLDSFVGNARAKIAETVLTLPTRAETCQAQSKTATNVSTSVPVYDPETGFVVVYVYLEEVKAQHATGYLIFGEYRDGNLRVLEDLIIWIS